jgi:hypothetical protein
MGKKCFCGCGRRVGWRVMRRIANSYGRNAAMATGFLGYVERVRPGWIQAHDPGLNLYPEPAAARLIGEGERYCRDLADVVHGEDSMRSIDRNVWATWRGEAFGLMNEFKAEFDPEKFALVMLKKRTGMSFEDACKRMARDPDWDPWLLSNNSPGVGALAVALKRGDSSKARETIRAIERAGLDVPEDWRLTH